MKEQLEHILKDKLQDLSVRPDPGDWTRIERSLGTEKPKRIPLFRYSAAAAAALLFAICGYVFFQPRPVTSDERLVSNAVLSSESTSARIVQGTAEQENEAIEAVRRVKEEIDRLAANGHRTIPAGSTPFFAAGQFVQGGGTETTPSGSAAETGSQQGQNPSQNTRTTGQPDNRMRNYADNTATPGRNNRRNGARTPNGNWSLALFADGAAGNSKNNNRKSMGEMLAMIPSPSASAVRTSADVAVFGYDERTGLSSLEVPQDWKHDMPLTFGFMVRRNLSAQWGVETGVTYTFLSSKRSTSAIVWKQQLHYVGIPVAATYTPIRTPDFDIYGRIGGAADFHVAGRKRADYSEGNVHEIQRFTTNEIQWSASANVGIMYNLSPQFGIYFEPGVSRYFESSGQPNSYWKEHSTNFNLKVGIRTNF